MPEQRIAFAGHAGEFRSGDPGGLHELELAADVGVETDKVQTRLIVRQRAGQRFCRSYPGAIRAPAPHQPVKAGGRDQIVAERNGIETERAYQSRDQAAFSRWKIRV